MSKLENPKKPVIVLEIVVFYNENSKNDKNCLYVPF